MMPATQLDTVFIEGLSDTEVLGRLIEYARAEAADDGQLLCAQLLSAALLALEMSPAEANRWCLEHLSEEHKLAS